MIFPTELERIEALCRERGEVTDYGLTIRDIEEGGDIGND